MEGNFTYSMASSYQIQPSVQAIGFENPASDSMTIPTLDPCDYFKGARYVGASIFGSMTISPAKVFDHA